jgi:hypothetical protein
LVFSAQGLLGRFDDETFGSMAADLAFHQRWLVRGTELRAHLGGGSLLGEPPVQALRFFGGRMTVPGYPFRSRVGDRYWLFRGEASTDLFPPILRLRTFGAAGGVRSGDLSAYHRLPTNGAAAGESSFLLSAGFGVALGWDVIRVDVARGLRDGGEWELILWVKQDFWPWL